MTSDKQGENSLTEKTLPEASVVISQPFWPCYLDQARIDKAKKLQLAITAGVGSDHVNLEAACKRGMTPFIDEEKDIFWWTFFRNYRWYVEENSKDFDRIFSLAEVTGSNVVSVAEHVVMQILALVRNFIPAYKVGHHDLRNDTIDVGVFFF